MLERAEEPKRAALLQVIEPTRVETPADDAATAAAKEIIRSLYNIDTQHPYEPGAFIKGFESLGAIRRNRVRGAAELVGDIRRDLEQAGLWDDLSPENPDDEDTAEEEGEPDATD
jgi:hypothetical protein